MSAPYAKYFSWNYNTSQPVVEKKILDLLKTDENTFNQFIKDYYNKNYDKEMCINPRTKKQTQRLNTYIGYDYARMKKMGHTIHYLYIPNNNNKIVAFAVLEPVTDKKINVLALICSNKDKTLKMKGKPLGIYLLDDIYETYVIDKKEILMIQPATDDLKKYYQKWKNPSLPEQKFFTYGFLVYFDNIDNITEEQFSEFIYGFKLFHTVCKHLKIDKNDIISIEDNSKRKEKLLEIVDENTNHFDEMMILFLKEELINKIKYYTSEEIRNELNTEGGSKSANKKNKITCKKKGGRKYKKSMKHKKGAKKC